MDEVSDIIKDSIEHSIGSQLYQQNMVNKWTNSVVENCLTRLCKLAKPFKYIGKTVLSLVFVTHLKVYHNFISLMNL